MNSIICLSHFCEMHGPTSVMCTQLLPSELVDAEIRANQESDFAGGCASCELRFPEPKNTDSGRSSYCCCMRSRGPSLSPEKDQKDDQKDVENGNQKDSRNEDVSFLSSSYPASQAKFKIIRQLCFRGLSTETTFNDSTPMMFTDPSLGSVLMMNFTVVDSVARGGQRRYGLMLVSETEDLLVTNWAVISKRLHSIIKYIQMKAEAARQRKFDRNHSANANANSNGTSYGLNSPTNARFLRAPRDHLHSPRSLTEILLDDEIFVNLHVRFCKLLYTINKEGQTP